MLLNRFLFYFYFPVNSIWKKKNEIWIPMKTQFIVIIIIFKSFTVNASDIPEHEYNLRHCIWINVMGKFSSKPGFMRLFIHIVKVWLINSGKGFFCYCCCNYGIKRPFWTKGSVERTYFIIALVRRNFSNYRISLKCLPNRVTLLSLLYLSYTIFR